MEIKKRPTKVRLFVLMLLFIAVAINYMDRANLSVSGSSIQSQFKLTSTQLGILFSAFTWSYTIAQLPVGVLLDKLGPRILYAVALVFWGIFTFVMGFSSHQIFTTTAASFAFLILCRVLIGVSEAPAYPSNTKIASLWFPNKERARAISTYSSAQYIGLAIFTPVLSIMITSLGWQSVFYFSGGIAVIYGFVWYTFYRDPKESTKVNDLELDYIKNNGGYNPDVDSTEKNAEKVTFAEIKYVIKQRRVWGIFIAQFAASSTLYFFLTWFIVYLQKGLHLSINKAGIIACAPYLMAMAGVLMGGTISDSLLKKGKSTTFSRKCPMIVGMLISSVLCLTNFFESSPVIAITILSVAFFANAASNLGWVAMSDIIPKNIMGTVGAILNLFGNLSGIITPIVFGSLLEKTNNFHAAIYYISAVSFIGAILFMIVVDKLEPIDLKEFRKSQNKFAEQ